MKREIYNLADEELAFLVSNLHEQMGKKGMPYILVGGTAVQAHTLSRLQRKTGKTLAELAEDPSIRLQDYVRSTDDVDLAIHSGVEGRAGRTAVGKMIFGILDELAVPEVISPSEDMILGYRLVRKGMKRPVFQVVIDGETDDERRLALNIGVNPADLENLDAKFYDEFVDAGQEVKMPYNRTFDVKTRVIKPEHLIASKVAKFRAKDTMDVHGLVDLMVEMGETPDLAEIKRLLLPDHEINYQRFLGLTKLTDPQYE